MSEQTLTQRLRDAQKAAMKARDKERLGTIRQILAELKRIEVDERVELDDQRVLAALDKMQKQRRESISQFDAAGRSDLSDAERKELEVIKDFLPAQLTSDELDTLVADAISQAQASSMQDMGKVMAILKPQVQGRADMGAVSRLIKTRLG